MPGCFSCFNCLRRRDLLTTDDVKQALEDIQEPASTIQDMQSEGNLTRTRVGIMCYLFNVILERVWTTLWCSANRSRPLGFEKKSDGGGSFELSLLNSRTERPKPKLPGLENANPEAYQMLKDALVSWMPYRDGSTVRYNKVGYWLHVLRYHRNVFTHRNMRLVEYSAPDGSPMRTVMKVAANPAISSYEDRNMMRGYLFEAGHHPLDDYHESLGNGWIEMPAPRAVQEMVHVLGLIMPVLEGMLQTCMPKAEV